MYAAFRAEGVEQYDKAMDAAGAKAQQTLATVSRLGVALAGLGAAMTAVSALTVKAAMAEEGLTDQLDALYGSAVAGGRVMDRLREVAHKTGIGLKPLADGVTALTTYFGDNEEQTKALIGPLANLAKYMNVDIPNAVASLGRAYAGGASDTIALRGPVLALIKDYARLKYGVDDISKMALPEFRKMLLQFLQDPTTKFAGHAEKVAKGLGGTFDRLKVSVGELAAAFGRELAPSLQTIAEGAIKVVNWLGQLPPVFKAFIAFTGSAVGVLATFAGGLIALLPQLLAVKEVLLRFGLTMRGLFATGGIVAIAIAGIAAIAYEYSWLTQKVKEWEAQNTQARAMNTLANAARNAKNRAEFLNAEIARLGSIAEATADKTGVAYRTITKQIAAYRAELVDLQEAAAQPAAADEARLKRIAETAKEIRRWMLEWREGERAAKLADLRDEWGRLNEAVKAGALTLDEAYRFMAARATQIIQETAVKIDKVNEVITEGAENVSDKFAAVGETVKSIGLEMADAFGRALGAMVAAGEVNVGQLLALLGQLIAKMLLVAGLQALFTALLGPVGGQFGSALGGGLFSGLFGGFEEPKMDTKAFRWGFDFARQFREGVNATLAGGLGLARMQPTAVPAGAAGVSQQFQVSITGATPDTIVRMLKLGRAGWREVLASGGLADAQERWAAGVRG